MPRSSTDPATPRAQAELGPDDPLLAANSARLEAGLSTPAFWRAVAVGRLPAPFYPAPRAPCWRRSEIRAALEATRALPADAKAARLLAARLRAARSEAKERGPRRGAVHGGARRAGRSHRRNSLPRCAHSPSARPRAPRIGAARVRLGLASVPGARRGRS